MRPTDAWRPVVLPARTTEEGYKPGPLPVGPYTAAPVFALQGSGSSTPACASKESQNLEPT